MSTYYYRSKDPFALREEMHEAKVHALNAEIVRLKIKCGEQITDKELMDGFGNPPTIFVPESRRPKDA